MVSRDYLVEREELDRRDLREVALQCINELDVSSGSK